MPGASATLVTRAARWRMTLSKAVELFIQEIRLTKAKATAAAYESDLRRLVALCPRNSVLEFSPDLVRLYFTTESSRGNAMSTLHRKMAAVSEFGKWGVRNRLWAANPVTTMPRIKRPKTLPRPFTDAEVERLLQLDLPPMERIIRALLFGTGLRATPLCGIRVGDVSENPPRLRVLVKGAKPQAIALHPELRDLLVSYMLTGTDLKGQTYLFRQRNGKPLTRRELEAMTHRWGEAAGVAVCLPHRFRHTFATGLLRSGVDVRVIQEAMGHEDIKSTVIYTEVTDAALDAAMLRLPWRLAGG
jgi:integrase/recombinase XerC